MIPVLGKLTQGDHSLDLDLSACQIQQRDSSLVHNDAARIAGASGSRVKLPEAAFPK